MERRLPIDGEWLPIDGNRPMDEVKCQRHKKCFCCSGEKLLSDGLSRLHYSHVKMERQSLRKKTFSPRQRKQRFCLYFLHNLWCSKKWLELCVIINDSEEILRNSQTLLLSSMLLRNFVVPQRFFIGHYSMKISPKKCDEETNKKTSLWSTWA